MYLLNKLVNYVRQREIESTERWALTHSLTHSLVDSLRMMTRTTRESVVASPDKDADSERIHKTELPGNGLTPLLRRTTQTHQRTN
jgi:hypothetical protein